MFSNANVKNEFFHILFKINKLFERMVSVVLIYSMFFMVIIVLINIFSRNFFNSSIYWIDELAGFCIILIGYFGAGIALKKSELMGVNFVINAMPKNISKYIIILVKFLIIIFCFMIFISSIKMVNEMFNLHHLSPALQVPMWILYSIILVTFFSIMFFSVFAFIDEIINR